MRINIDDGYIETFDDTQKRLNTAAGLFITGMFVIVFIYILFFVK